MVCNGGVGFILFKLETVWHQLKKHIDSSTTCIHPTFHVSQLKKHIGSAVTSPVLPPTRSDGVILKEPNRVLNRLITKKKMESSNHKSLDRVG